MSYNITSWRTGHLHMELPIDFDFQGWLRGLPDRDEEGHENVGKRWLLEDDAQIFVELAPSQPAIKAEVSALIAPENTWKIDMCNQAISGIIKEDRLMVTALNDWTGDCSGILYNDILLPLFAAFKGNLEAFIVWEGGNSLTLLNIRDGVVDEQNRE